MSDPSEGGVAVARRGHNVLKQVPTPLSNISAVLYSNSGLVPLANRKYTLQLGKERTLAGKTDEKGFLQHLDVPPGDYTLMIDGVNSVVPTVANPDERLPLRVGGYNLLPADVVLKEEGSEDEEDEEEETAEAEWEDLEEGEK
ncbi:MAG: hypothetical protein OEW45_18030 [Deltaproteobacteria bacterium]|nr:hypothetical protein [Deltaproteobacteria bacterium]